MADGVRVATAWDVAAVHRLLFGGWRAAPARTWAALRDLAPTTIPALGQLDLLGGAAGGDDGDPEVPVRPDGHLRPEWAAGGWADHPDRLAALGRHGPRRGATSRAARLDALAVGGDAALDRAVGIGGRAAVRRAGARRPAHRRRRGASASSPPPSAPDRRTSARPTSAAAPVTPRCWRTRPYGGRVDLRNPAQVRALLRQVGVDVPDTRAWRLETVPRRPPARRRAAHVAQGRAHRHHVRLGLARRTTSGADGRLRGAWSGSDGAAGRMTAEAGLHNLPAEMRPAVAAGPGHVFVRADLGQIEPRVLAAVSGDAALARATQADDLYAPVAKRLGVERAVAKVGVLAAMYGQTSGVAGQALQGLERAYPTAMGYLRAADDEGRAGRDVRTHGGRLVRMGDTPDDLEPQAERSLVRRRAAATPATPWSRARRPSCSRRGRPRCGRAPRRTVPASCSASTTSCSCTRPSSTATRWPACVDDCLAEASARWAPGGAVRFVADTSVIDPLVGRQVTPGSAALGAVHADRVGLGEPAGLVAPRAADVEAAVDDHLQARHPLAVVRRQEQRGVGDVAALADARAGAGRARPTRASCPCAPRTSSRPPHEIGRAAASGVAMMPGQMAVDADVGVAQLGGRRLREVDDRRLGHVVQVRPVADDEPGHRRGEMIEPDRCAVITGAACLMPKNTPFSSTSNVRSYSSSLIEAMGPMVPPNPALLNITSSRPQRCAASCTSDATSSSFDTSQ